MSMSDDPIPFPNSHKNPHKEADLGWSFLIRWAIGGVILLSLVFGACSFAAWVTMEAGRRGHPLLGVLWGLTFLAVGLAGVSWAKTQWLIHVLPEVLEDFEKKTMDED